jgi:hypothetical protein
MGRSPVLGDVVNRRHLGKVVMNEIEDVYLQVITSQTSALANQRNDIELMRRQLDASILLIKALGGGWDVQQLPKS